MGKENEEGKREGEGEGKGKGKGEEGEGEGTRAIWCCSVALYLLSSPWFQENSSTSATAAFHFNYRQQASIGTCQWHLFRRL